MTNKWHSVVWMMLGSLLLLSGCGKEQGLHTEEVEYTANGTVMKGYLAYDPSIEGKRPGVLVVHEWWGHNEYVRRRARELAELGYTAFALDMYGEGRQAKHPKEAGKFVAEARTKWERSRARFMAALNLLREHETTDSEKMAAIGYCFGGGVVLHMAREGVDLDGVVSFHGSLGTERPAQPGAVKAKVLVLHGAEDQFVGPEQVQQFKEEMEQAGVDFDFIAYEGATHSFTNPDADEYAKKFNIPIGYNEQADKKSWEAMRQFLQEIFE